MISEFEKTKKMLDDIYRLGEKYNGRISQYYYKNFQSKFVFLTKKSNIRIL